MDTNVENNDRSDDGYDNTPPLAETRAQRQEAFDDAKGREYVWGGGRGGGGGGIIINHPPPTPVLSLWAVAQESNKKNVKFNIKPKNA